MTNYLADYAYFTNKFDLDKTASQHKQANWNKMNHTDRDVLDIIRRYSVKFGAAHLKHDTIAQAIKKSNSNVRRTLRKLIQLEIIDRTHYVRPVMNGLGANIYAIKPYVEASKPTQYQAKTPQPVIEKTSQIEQPPVPTTLFGRMKQMLTSTIGEDKLARLFFGAYRQLTIPMLKFTIYEDEKELFEQLGIQALLIAIQSTKHKSIQNFPGYYSGILRKLIDNALFSDAFKDYDVSVGNFYFPENKRL